MLTIDLDAREPLHEQIVRGLREAVAHGRVRVGDRLPSVRQLAGDLAVNLNTVARAYRRLEEEGLLRVRHGQGVVVVSDRVGSADRPAALAALERAVAAAVADARLHGLGDADVRRAVERAIAACADDRGARRPPRARGSARPEPAATREA